MAKQAETQEASGLSATLCSLPHDTLGKIIRELRFQVKCSLELVCQDFHSVLSRPLPTEGLWGTCDLMADLKVKQRFDSTGDIMRWLTKRLPGFTHLVCNAAYAHQADYTHQSAICDTNAAASWLVAHLPKLCRAGTSAFVLHLTLDTGLATRLLRLSTNYQGIQDNFWTALSESLTELVVTMDPHADEPVRMDVLTQLTRLTSLRIDMVADSNGDRDEVAASYTLSLPGLKSLHMSQIIANDLTVLCPGLRSLTMEYSNIRGSLTLPAFLEEVSIREHLQSHMHGAFPVSSMLGLTSLLCDVPRGVPHEPLYGALPSMTSLRSLDLILLNGELPGLLPSSLRAIRCIWLSGDKLSAAELERVAGACQLPELQSVGLYSYYKWSPGDLQLLENFTVKSSAKVSVMDDWKDGSSIIFGDVFS